MTAERPSLLNPQDSKAQILEQVITPTRIQQVVDLMPSDQMVQAIRTANPQLPPGAAEGVVIGDQGRVRLLGDYYSRFLASPISHLLERGVIEQGYSASELGPSFLVHYALLDPKLQPGSVKGYDNRPHVVAAGRVNIQALEKAGLFPAGKYKVIDGDHTLKAKKSDVAFLSLVSQYESGEEGAIIWLMNNGEKVGINGDVIHGLNPITTEELESGVLRVKSKRSPDLNTGIAWKLNGNPNKTAFGDVYDAQFMLDPQVFTNARVKHLKAEGDRHDGKITVYQKDGSLYFNGWATEPTVNATEAEIEKVVAIRDTFDDIYLNLGVATGNQQVWDGNSAAAIPARIAQSEDLYTTATFTTLKDSNIPGTLPWAIVRRHQPEVMMLYAKGLLSRVGEGKTFATPQELYRTVDSLLGNPQEYVQKFNYQNPLLITTITTKDRSIFEAITA